MIVDAHPLPQNVQAVVEDSSRLAVLSALDVVGSEPDVDFDRLARAAARLFGAEVALVALVERERQWFRSCFGIEGISETQTADSFCAHTIAIPQADGVLVVRDAQEDDRFRNNPLVTGWPGIRFYAGAPITVLGQKIGSLCVIGLSPREHVDESLPEQLAELGALASSLFALKDEAKVRARTAAALMKEEWRHALTLEAGKVGSWIWEIPSGEIACNDTFRKMYQLADSGPISIEQVLAATHPGDRAALEGGLAASLTSGADFDAEVRVATTGRWLTLRGRVYQRNAAGKPLVMMGASIDISESKHSADQTRLLLRELNHRVKNTLAMIQSVARQTIRQNPDPKTFIEAFSGRLRTISDAHVLLADRDWSGIQMYEVIGSQLGPAFLTNPDRAEVHGADIKLPADHALGLGLILHELTTNAHRHGAWSTGNGVVSISWSLRREPTSGLSVRWEERGGPDVSPSPEYGLGARLIERSLAKVLDSKVDLNFRSTGVVADIWLPLTGEEVATYPGQSSYA